MRFRLIYRGPLKSNASPKIKAQIRAVFDEQLRRLWEQAPLDGSDRLRDLQHHQTNPNNVYVGVQRGPIEFIPLVSSALQVRAELDILLLTNTPPGEVIGAGGDLDNRVKTLLDALTIPVLPIPIDTPGADGRIYTLLEDDKLVSRLSVETDRSLVIDSKSREVLTILSVSVFAVRGTLANIGIAL